MGLLDRLAGEDAHQKAASRPAARPHRFDTCGDENCTRLPCIAYRDGYQEGYQAGYAAGASSLEASPAPGAHPVPQEAAPGPETERR